MLEKFQNQRLISIVLISVIGITIFCISLAVLAPLSFKTPAGYPYFGDEGSLMHAADRIASGEHLYRDIFYFKAPLSYYVIGWLFIFLPTDLGTMRLAGAVLLSLLVTCTCFLVVSLTRKETAEELLPWMLGGVIWITLMLIVSKRISWDNSWCASLASVITTILYVRTSSHSQAFYLLMTGVAVGVAFLSKQTFGVALMAGIVAHRSILCVLTKHLKHLQDLRLISTGFISVLLTWILYMYQVGAVENFFELAFMYPLKNFELMAALSSPMPEIYFTKEAALFYVPLILLFVLGVRKSKSIWREPHRTSPELAYTLIAIFLYAAMMPTLDYTHLRPVLPISLIVLALHANHGVRLFSLRVQRSAGIGMLLATIGFSLWSINPSTATSVLLDVPQSENVTVDKSTASEIQQLIKTIDMLVDRNDPIVVVPWDPLIYIFSERPNPTKFRIIGPGEWNAKIYQNQFISDIEKTRVKLVVYSSNPPGFRFDNMSEYAEMLDSYIQKNFKEVSQVGRFQILIKRVPQT